MRLKVIYTEKFSNMPVSTRCLYFELIHTADENHVCKRAGAVLKRGNYALDDLVILIKKGFAKVVQEGVELTA